MRLPLFALTAGLVWPVTISAADTIELKDGDTLTGTIVETTDDTVTLDHPTLGPVTIARSNIVEAPQASSDGEMAAQEAAEEFGNWVDSWLFSGWDKSIAAGFTGTDGNSDTLNVYASLKTDYEDERDRWLIDLKYFRNTSEGETTQNQFKGLVNRDWLKPDSPWFYWAQGLGQYDQFTDWETRAGLFGGPGYTFFDGPVHTVLGRVGVGGQYEWGDVNEFTPEAMVGVDWEWAISETQSFTFYNYLYPSLDPGFSEFRNLTGALYEVALAAGNGLKLQLGIENEYVSDVAPGFDENDFKYFGALAFDF